MSLLMTSNLASSFTVESAFRDQTYALFEPGMVSLKVTGARLTEIEDGYIAYADLAIKINVTREELLASTSDILRKNYVNYKFPDGINNTDKDRDLADNILSSGIAEFILMSTFGSDIKKNKVIYRPQSQLKLIEEKNSGRTYLEIFGEKVYVSE